MPNEQKRRGTKQYVDSWIKSSYKFYKEFDLPDYPGMYCTTYAVRHMDKLTPAYVLPIKNTGGQPFIMPDFIKHEGVIKGSGYQNFSHDTHHLLQKNVEENMPYIKNDYGNLHTSGTPGSRWRCGVLGDGGILEGKTLIICAPGPSLTPEKIEAIAEARRTREDVVVLSINRAVRGVASDFVLFVERHIPAEWRDEHVFELQKDAILLATPQTDYRVIRDWPDQEAMFFGFFNMGNFVDDTRINHLTLMDAMASTTAATAIRTGYELGAEKIISVGMDFCCEMEVKRNKIPVPYSDVLRSMTVLESLADEVSKGNGKKQRVKDLATVAQDFGDHCEKYLWTANYLQEKFYFDQDYKDTEYVGDPRFSKWQPIVNKWTGRPVHTTLEFLSYLEQLKVICAFVEGVGGVKIYNASPEGLLDWNKIVLEDALAA